MLFLKQEQCLSYYLQREAFFLFLHFVSQCSSEKPGLSTKERFYPLRRISDDALNNEKLCFYLINL